MTPSKLIIKCSLGLDPGELKAVNDLLDVIPVFLLKDFEGLSLVSHKIIWDWVPFLTQSLLIMLLLSF